MTDVMTPEQRSRCMRAIKSANTRPEMLVRRYLFARGFRYRINNQKLPGSPDIVLKKYRTVIFIDGCFWHGHEGCRYARLPKSNVDFWRQKIALNYARDYANNIDLRLEGWKVIRIWECELRTKARREETMRKLEERLKGIGNDSGYHRPDESTDSSSIAAEPGAEYGSF